MQAPFERTLRALSAERRKKPWALIAALLVIGAWVAWAVLAEVGVHVTSVSGRIEAKEPVNVLRAEVDGRLVAVHATLGQSVAVGDVLYEIDRADAEIQKSEAAAKKDALTAERAVLSAAVDAANQAKDTGQDVLLAALAEARARLGQSRAALSQDEHEVARLNGLAANGGVPTQDVERARTQVAMRRAEIAAAAALSDKLSAEESREASDRTAALERMRQELVRLDADKASLDADARAAEVASERRRVRVPIAGKIGELPLLRPGDFVQAGQPLGTIVPSGELHVVAFFAADRALGWVRPGAPARVRLDAFPWTWFGQLDATVAQVALEPKDGLLRVELSLPPVTQDGATAATAATPAKTGKRDIPLGHGLTGEVEIAVEQVSPLALLLRAAGKSDP